MTSEELKAKIKTIIPTVYKARQKVEAKAVEYDELTKFPELKEVIVDLLTADFDSFLASIDWVAPRPTTFRINLKNGEDFYLIYNKRSWVAQVEGKKYYLLNLPEEERAAEAIARMLRYGAKDEEVESVDVEGAEDISIDDSETETETVEV
tara:strand:- start:751 stop:1203 length:453 start_codon:yes stop_codon:yes gene_type:complete